MTEFAIAVLGFVGFLTVAVAIAAVIIYFGGRPRKPAAAAAAAAAEVVKVAELVAQLRARGDSLSVMAADRLEAIERSWTKLTVGHIEERLRLATENDRLARELAKNNDLLRRATLQLRSQVGQPASGGEVN